MMLTDILIKLLFQNINRVTLELAELYLLI